MHHSLELPPRILQQFVKPMVATAVMSLGTYLSYEAVRTYTHSLTLSLLVSVAIAVCIYAALVYTMKIITWYDCQVLPKGELIARLLRVKQPETE